jgi:hypothetical protein
MLEMPLWGTRTRSAGAGGPAIAVEAEEGPPGDVEKKAGVVGGDDVGEFAWLNRVKRNEGKNELASLHAFLFIFLATFRNNQHNVIYISMD